MQPIALVGTAVLLILVSLRVLQWVRHSVDDREAFDGEPGHVYVDGYASDEDEWDYEQFPDDGLDVVVSCDHCGVNSEDDFYLFHNEYGELDHGDDCPQCSEPLRGE